MTTMPMMHIHRTGTNITLMCSAESKPEATIQWMFDGMYLNQSGPQLKLERVAESNSGSYTCLFHNTVTSRFASASEMIMVLGKVGFKNVLLLLFYYLSRDTLV